MKKYAVKNPKTIADWKKKAWDAFRFWIYARDNDTCFTCNATRLEGSNRQGGHFMTGASCPPSLYFHEANVHVQCLRCNKNLSGNWVEYLPRMEAKYGKEFVDNLQKLRRERQGEKWEIEQYKEIISKYSPY